MIMYVMLHLVLYSIEVSFESKIKFMWCCIYFQIHFDLYFVSKLPSPYIFLFLPKSGCGISHIVTVPYTFAKKKIFFKKEVQNLIFWLWKLSVIHFCFVLNTTNMRLQDSIKKKWEKYKIVKRKKDENAVASLIGHTNHNSYVLKCL